MNWSFLNNQVFLGILRNILLSFGMVLVTSGVFTEGTLLEIIGAIMSIISAVLSGISNNNKSKAVAIERAVEEHPRLTVVPPMVGVSDKAKIAISANPKPVAESLTR